MTNDDAQPELRRHDMALDLADIRDHIDAVRALLEKIDGEREAADKAIYRRWWNRENAKRAARTWSPRDGFTDDEWGRYISLDIFSEDDAESVEAERRLAIFSNDPAVRAEALRRFRAGDGSSQ